MKFLPTILLAIAAASGGFFLGQSKETTSEQGTEQGSAEETTRLSALDPDAYAASAEVNANYIGQPPKSASEAAAQIRVLLNQKQSARRDLQLSIAALWLDEETLQEVWSELELRSGFSDYGSESHIVHALVRRWAEIDPHAAIEAANQTNGWMKSSAISTVASVWAEKEPDAALAWVEGLPNSQHRERAMSQVLTSIGKTDRARALDAYFKAVDSGSITLDRWSGGEMFSQWAQEEPDAATAGALTVLERTKSDSALRGALSTWALKDTDATLAWVNENLEGDTQRRMLDSVFESWSMRDPEAATKHVLTLEDRQQWQSAIRQVLTNWAVKDFKSSTAWIDSIEDPDRRAEARAALLTSSGWSGTDERAANYALPYLDNQKTKNALQNLAWNWGRRDPDGMMKWFEENVTDKALVDNMRFHVIQQKTWENPAQAAEQLSDLPPGKKREEQFSNVASNWASKNLDAAREWANALSEGTERDLALASVTRTWIAQDSETATAWINNLERGDLRDQMTSQLAGHHAAQNRYENALDAARQVENPHRRTDAFESTLRMWMHRDPKAARKFIEGTDEIDAHTRWRLLTPR